MSAPSVMDVLREARSFMASAHPTYDTAEKMGAAIAAVTELVAAVKHDFDTRRRVPFAGPQDLQDATDRVAVALARFGVEA